MKKMTEIRFITQNREPTGMTDRPIINAGITLIECVMALLILSIVLLPALYSFSLAGSAGIYAENAYKAGMLLEGIIAEARLTGSDRLCDFSEDGMNDIWDLVANCDSEDMYDFALIIEEPASGKSYAFTDNESIEFTSEALGASLDFSPQSSFIPDTAYDLIIEDYIPLVTISEDVAGSFYIAVLASSASDMEIVNKGNANIFVDMYGECAIIYRGRGLLVERPASAAEPYLLISCAVYSKDKTQLNAMVCAGRP